MRLLLVMIVHPILIEAAEAMGRANMANEFSGQLMRGDTTLEQAQARVIQRCWISFNMKQLMAMYKRFMLLNMGTPGATLIAVSGAAVEEAITRSFMVELDKFIRAASGQPKLEGAELTMQRLVWMTDTSMASIAEFNAIFTSTFAMILLERHALFVGLGYIPGQAVNSGVVFVQLMLELTLEMLVDNATM